MPRYRLAFDFGTTNSLLMALDAQTNCAQPMELPGLSQSAANGCPLLPTLLYVEDGSLGQVTVGQAVRNAGLDQRRDNRLFRNFKRNLMSAGSQEPRLIDGTPWNDKDAARHFLRAVLAALPCPLDEVERWVMTVPVAASEAYIAWINQTMAALPVPLQVVDESTAAALGYAVAQPGARVVVFDFGGGSLDLSLVQLSTKKSAKNQHGLARVMAKAGVTLGGSDIDQWLLAWSLEQCGLSVEALGYDYPRLLSACEAAKIALSLSEEVPLNFSASGKDYSLLARRQMFEDLLQKNGMPIAIRRVLDKLFSAAQQRGLFREDVSHVLMVGGTSLIPSVQRAVQDYFGVQRVRVDKPFNAVAEGALQVALGLGLEDYLMHSYGLRTLDRKTGLHRYEEVVAMGSCIPSETTVEVQLEASQPGQRMVEFVIGEVNSEALEAAEVRYQGGQTALVAKAGEQVEQIIPLNLDEKATRVQLNPPGQPGKVCLQAHFSVDIRRQLRLTVIDPRTRRELLHDFSLIPLGDAPKSQSGPAGQPEITGLEPALHLIKRGASGERRLSLRGFLSLLLANVISPKKVSLDALAATLHGDDFLARFNAAEVLSKRGDRDARLALEQALENGAAPVRASVARQLHHLTWFSAEALFRRALADPDLRVAESAVYALGLNCSPAAVKMLEGFLPGAPDVVLRSAVWGLERSPTAEAVPALALALRAVDGEIRSGALEALGSTGAPEAVDPVRGALFNDPDLEVRYAAAQSLVELLAQDSFPILCAEIENRRGMERECLLRGFFHASNYSLLDVGTSRHIDQVLETLENAFSDDLGAVRLLAGKILAWMRHPRAAELLRVAFKDEPDPEVQSYLLYHTWCLMSPVREELLVQAMDSSLPAVRKTAEYLKGQAEHPG